MAIEPTPLVVRAASDAVFEVTLECVSAESSPKVVKVLEKGVEGGEALHECMREVSQVSLVRADGVESHPRVSVVIETIGAQLFASKGRYKLRLEKVD